ncbi:MAG TPA: hypothetical protein GYA08_01635 [Chloroflexi bacterium]|nr:hypothetical protein [Chloroflexota bacterium]
MSKQLTAIERIAVHAKYVEWIDKEEDNWETFAWHALIVRSNLETQWNELTEMQRAQIATIDDVLAANYRRLQDILPAADEHPRTEWWWFLYEGPQVREAALRSA